MHLEKVSPECSACQLFGDYMCAGMEDFDYDECENLRMRSYEKTP